MKLLVILFKLKLRFVYFFLKLMPVNPKKSVFISRQSDSPTIEFKLIKDQVTALDKEQKIIMLTKTIKGTLFGCIGYYFHLYAQMYHLATSKMCVLDSYCITVSVLRHKRSLKIIQIWHALGAIKQFGYQTLGKKMGRSDTLARFLDMHRNYDVIVCGSDAMKPVFAEAFGTNEEKVVSIGIPRIDYLLHNHNKIRRRIYEAYPNLRGRKVILYAPTFRKDDSVYTESLVSEIDFENYCLIVKQHPIKKFGSDNQNILTCSKFTGLELLTAADFVVTDYSAISIEASILEKPVYFYLYDYEEYASENGVNIDFEKEMPGCIFSHAPELVQSIESGHYDISLIKRFKDKYVTNQKGNSAYLLANYIVSGRFTEGESFFAPERNT